jgi:hypothetical protein
MNPAFVLIGIVAAPVIILTLLRVNAAIIFLSLCLGDVLLRFVGDEAANTVGIIASNGSTDPALVSIGLILLPAIFTTLIMMRTVKGHLKLALNIVPAISVGVLGLLLLEPFFADGLRAAVEGSEAWYLITKLQTIVISASAILSVFFLWLQRPKAAAAKEEKHK